MIKSFTDLINGVLIEKEVNGELIRKQKETQEAIKKFHITNKDIEDAKNVVAKKTGINVKDLGLYNIADYSIIKNIQYQFNVMTKSHPKFGFTFATNVKI